MNTASQDPSPSAEKATRSLDSSALPPGALRVEQIGDAMLYLGDCRDILPGLGKVDAVVTDPPYGLGDRLKGGAGEWAGGFLVAPAWDRDVVAGRVVETLAALGPTIVWGGNYYELPPVRGWLLWDKMQEHSSGHAELAWTNIEIPVRTFRYARAQLASEGKQHPTQKPLPLMAWCLGFVPGAHTILDPFMGSGTTGVACAQLGRTFIGIEREPTYFDIACRRIAEAYRQPRLFDEPTPKPVQGSLLEGPALSGSEAVGPSRLTGPDEAPGPNSKSQAA